jgi:hypothetical protein
MSFKEFFVLYEGSGLSKRYYHVCDDTNLDSILKYGLKVGVGHRSAQLEEEPGIFLFKTVDDAVDGVMNWLGDEYEEDVILSLLEIRLPTDFPLEENANSYETISRIDIPNKYIKVYKRDF